MQTNFNLDNINTKPLIIILDTDVLMKECRKIDENHWYYIMKEMFKHKVYSKIYRLLNKRLKELNINTYQEKTPPLLVG